MSQNNFPLILKIRRLSYMKIRKNKVVIKNIAQGDIRLDLKYKIVQDGYWDGARFASSLRTDYTYKLADWHFRDIGVPKRSLGDGGIFSDNLVNQPISYYSTLGEWLYWGFSAVGSSSVELKGYGKDGEILVSYTDAINPLPIGQLKLWVWDTNAIDYVDDVRIRKYASSEPLVGVGTEKSPETQIPEFPTIALPVLAVLGLL